MLKGVSLLSILLELGLLCLQYCSPGDRFNFPKATIIVGEVEIIRKGVHLPLVQNQYLKSKDTVRVKNDSKVKFELQDGAFWYLGPGAELIIGEPVPAAETKRRLPVFVSQGQLHIVKRNDQDLEYSISLLPWVLRVTDADITINAGSDLQLCSISLIRGFATFTPLGGFETVIPVCSRLVAKKGEPGELQPIDLTEIDALKLWVGSSIIEDALLLSGCTIGERTGDTINTVNTTPPEWRRLPDETARLGELVSDTVEAVDPEQGTVTYTLLQGVEGMHLDSITGILSYRASSPGKNTVFLRATDPQGNACTTTVEITVTGGFSVHLSAPSMVGPGIPFDIIASVEPSSAASHVMFRFDLNGDGIYEMPGDGKFTKTAAIKNHRISIEKVYRLRVEAHSDDGQSVWAGRTITINAAPEAILKVIPQRVPLGSPVVFDISASTDERNGAIPLRVRYDTDGDGSWDIPPNGIISVARTLTYYYKESGTFTVRAQLTDKDGASSTVSTVVVIEKDMVVDSNQHGAPPIENKLKAHEKTVEVDAGGPYHTMTNRECRLQGTVRGSINTIKTYFWDADGDGVVDVTSKTLAPINYIFKKAGGYTAYFSIETNDGRRITDSVHVDVRNVPPKAMAGNDIVSYKNKKVRLFGSGSDEDGTITVYEWDFNGDGIFDSRSETGTVDHSFNQYTQAVLRVTDSNGANGYDTIAIIVCPDEMETVESGKFCIDRFEFPNKRHSMPQADVTYEEAKSTCIKLGKRLCTPDEWEMACADARKNNRYPYGKKFETEKCNTLGNPRRKNSLAPSGDFIECKNSRGVYDMSGNVAEWTAEQRGDHFVYGGSWQNGEQGTKCTSRLKLTKDKKYFYTGFRCCK